MNKSHDTAKCSQAPDPNNSYHNILENLYVMGNKANYDWLMESKAQLESSVIRPEITERTSDFAYCNPEKHML